MDMFNELGRRRGSDVLRKALCRACASCAAEGVGQFGEVPLGAGLPEDWHGGAKLSAGAFSTKNVLSETRKKTSMGIAIAILPSTFDMTLRRIL